MTYADMIKSQDFPMVRRGYDPAAVRTFLDELAQETLAREPDEDDLRRLRQIDHEVLAAQQRVDALNRHAEELHRYNESVAQPAPAAADDVLVAARARAEEIIEAARREAEAHVASAQAEADAHVASAQSRSEALVTAAQADADEVYQNRWREVGDLVTRILESAEAEAAGLRSEAENLAVEVRTGLQIEVARVRSDADRHAADVRSRAEEYAAARLAAAESEQEQAAESAAAARADAERVVSEAQTRANEAIRRADEAVKAHVAEQLALARNQIERLRADEIELTARLTRVQEMVGSSLEVASAREAPSLGEPTGFLLRLAEPEVEPDLASRGLVTEAGEAVAVDHADDTRAHADVDLLEADHDPLDDEDHRRPVVWPA